MNLVSCDNCAIVLDAKKLQFPISVYNENKGVDPKKSIWDGNDFIPAAPCPYCKELIGKPD